MEENTLLLLSGGERETFDQFPNLGPQIAASGRVDVDVDKIITCTKASKVFGVLRKAVFLPDFENEVEDFVSLHVISIYCTAPNILTQLIESILGN